MRFLPGVFLLVIVLIAEPEISAQKFREPLPIESVASYRSFIGRADLSPDGEWLAYTVDSGDLLSFPSFYYSSSGVPGAGSRRRREIWLTNSGTGKTIKLSRPSGSSWSGSWSPDGRMLAFYSDWNGKAGLWCWDKAKGQASQVSPAIVRALFSSEVVRWTSDSRRVLCKILPERMSVEEANRLIPSTEISRFPKVDESAPSVFVLRAPAESHPTTQASIPLNEIERNDWSNSYFADLALINVRSGRVTRIAKEVKPLWYSFSPDEKYIAYTTHTGWELNSQQSAFDLVVVNIETIQATRLATNVRMSFGRGVSWAPNGKSLSYLTSGPRAAGECYVVSVQGLPPRKVGGANHPSFAADSRPPLWDATGENLYFLSEGNLWRIALKSESALKVTTILNRKITEVMFLRSQGTVWTPDKGRSIVVNTSDDVNMMAGFYRIDLQTGEAAKLTENNCSYFSYDAFGRSLVFVKQDAQRAWDLWLTDAELRNERMVSHLNPDFDKYEMGASKLIEWTGAQGEKLRGALILPPGYREGRRYPLVVWLYGGDFGSRYVNRFGFWGDTPAFNLQVLATRGYVVLFPDAPLGKSPAKDLFLAVMPGVNKAVELGFADRDRLAVMGQSYGSYSTVALITQTNRFKAAVISAVLDANLTSSYLRMNRDGSAAGLSYYEEGQGGMGGTLWQYRDRYVENSPVFHLDKIQTPVLMAHGTRDSTPSLGPDQIFVALRRLGKEVEYLQYENEEHVIERKANVIDFWKRRLDWLDKWLDISRDQQGYPVWDREKVKSRNVSQPLKP